jgi:hypothetical protein
LVTLSGVNRRLRNGDKAMNKKILVPIILTAFLLIVTLFSSAQTQFMTQTINNNHEIITFISGSAYSSTINKEGIVRDIEIYAGAGGTLMEINGWRWQPLEHFTIGNVQYIHAYHFIGVDLGKPYGPVRGIAFGNIEWS